MKRIIGVAVKFEDGRVLALPPPARHPSVLLYSQEEGYDSNTPSTQGFITSECQFVDRVEALQIAKDASQLLPHIEVEEQLYSENLW